MLIMLVWCGALGWSAWAVASPAVHHQAWLESLGHYQSSHWLWEVAAVCENLPQTNLSRLLDFMGKGEL